MSNRSANATIKGYFYQFDHTIVQLLAASSPHASVVVEGIEDIDLDDGDNSLLVQCKYYEGTTYNHSVIKDAVIQMMRHFHSLGCPTSPKFRYRIFGHYKEGQEKLDAGIDLDLLKGSFLTYVHDKVKHEVHSELGISDAQLNTFCGMLNVNIKAPSYEEQQKQVVKLLVSQISGCKPDDAEIFYYPNAINVIQALAIPANESDRRITKGNFIAAVNRKEIVLSMWLRQKFGDDYYAKLIKKKHFRFPSTRVPKASRIFAIDMTDEFDLTNAVTLLSRIGTTLSHVEHTRTPQQDRFCPYVLLRGLKQEDLISLKGCLLNQGVSFEDGYPFNGAPFSPAHLAMAPTKDNLLKLKFIPAEDHLGPVVSAVAGSATEVFDFFKTAPLDMSHAPAGIAHHKIKIDGTYFINEVL